MPSVIQADLLKDSSATKTLATLSSSAVTLSSDVTVPASVGGTEILLETYTGDNSVHKVFEFTGSYNVYRLLVNRLIPSTDNSNLKIDLGTSSSSFDDSSGDYLLIDARALYDGSTTHVGQNTSWKDDFLYVASIGGNASEGVNLDITILSPTDSTQATYCYGIGGSFRQDNYIISHNFTSKTDYTARDDSHVRIKFHQGNLADGKGTISLYGIKNA